MGNAAQAAQVAARRAVLEQLPGAIHACRVLDTPEPVQPRRNYRAAQKPARRTYLEPLLFLAGQRQHRKAS